MSLRMQPLAVAGVLFAGAIGANGAVLTLQNGANGVGSDGTVFFAGTYSGAQNTGITRYNGYDYGGQVNLQVNENNDTVIRGLWYFDVSAIKTFADSHPGLDITGATLVLHQQNTGTAGTVTQNLYQIKDANAGWGVGVGDGTAAGGTPISGAATYFDRNAPGGVVTSVSDPGAWGNYGGYLGPGAAGYISTALASPSVSAIGLGGTNGTAVSFAFDPTGSLVEHWMGTANAGLLLTGATGSTQAVYYWGNKYSANPTFRPELQIIYSIPEPMGLAPLLLSSVGLMSRKRRN